MRIKKWILDSFEKPCDLPKFSRFKDFLHSGFSLNKEDRLSSFQIEFTPWLNTVADWLDDSETEWINLIQGSQTGKTTVQMAFLLYVSQKYPTRVMWVQSTEEEAKQFITERLRPCIQDYDGSAIHKKGWRIESFRVFKARVKVAYATNEQTLRSVPAQYIIGDECAVWKHPISLLKKRTRTFSGIRKGIFVTTPPRDGNHFSWKEACAANFFRWYVPCPICNEFQALTNSGLKWEGKEGDHWNFEKVKETTRYQCIKCKGFWEESQKLRIINSGKPICVDPLKEYKETPERKDTAKTLQISSLYSVFTTWGEFACNFIQAKHGCIEDLKIFITDELAEVPINLENSESLQDSLLAKFVDPHRNGGFLPGYDVYTAGVDVQRNGELYCVVVGWKAGVIPTGHVLIADCVSWQGGNFQTKWAHFLNFFAPFQASIARIAIDATDGMVSQEIFDFCNYVGKVFIPLKDSTTLHLKTCLKTITPEVNGRKTNRTQVCLLANSDKVKDDIASSFQRSPGEIGAFSFPSNIGPDFIKALTTEHRIQDKSGKSSWAPKYSHAPNHYFSALVYAASAMEEFRLYLQADLKNAKENLSGQGQRKVRNVGVDIWR